MSDHRELGESHSRKRQNSINTEDISKRQRHNASDLQTQTEVWQKQARRKLTYADYTVGWICALYSEMTAAIAMLDEEHESLPRHPGDDNVYTLGSIWGHNVVIASLPNGVYGTTSATAVGVTMRSSYPNSTTVPLMVGIGGGVPSKTRDIRLGDVVVGVPTSEGPAVRQYDYGKTVTNGVSEFKGQLNRPASVLLNAVAKLRTEHDLGRGKQVRYITQAIERYKLAAYTYPGTELDNLLEFEHGHPNESELCSSHSPKYMVRPLRLNNNPIIHYGTVGSGNQVMKDAQTRDRIAKELGVVCFEMEAAGLMDYLPCLIVRGICDYCDAQKNKDFQRYAALSAAAYAKELLSVIPAEKEQPVDSTSDRSTILKRRKAVMEALNFGEAQTRRATVRKAHTQTCKWFVEQEHFTHWRDMGKNHNSLLWVKGKPGTGKSTLMKFILEGEEESKPKDCIIISYFFHARGHHLERSVIGMYRSLVHQLLREKPELQVVLDGLGTAFSQDKLSAVEDLFKRVVEKLDSTKLLCFIDALDECPEEQIRDMVYLFEDLGKNTVSNGFRILFSSRHYPNISIEQGTTLILEDQAGHSSDIVKYINTELKIGSTKQVEQIKQEIFERSRGIFLWVFLTLKILKTEYDKGRMHSLKDRLKEIPLELDDLFRDILTRDNQRLPELIRCIQWILYAQRPLLREELYVALLIGDNSVELSSWDHEGIATSIMDNFILDCSKGLAELTREIRPTVQFIHESVREFLLQPHALAGLWPGFQGISEGLSHQQLRGYCTKYIALSDLTELNTLQELEVAKSESFSKLRRKMRTLYPFLQYAVRYVLCHADSAEQSQLSQIDFLHSFRLEEWRHIYILFQKYTRRRLPQHQTLACILATLDLQHLLLMWLSHVQRSEIDLETLIATLFTIRKPDLCKKVVVWHWSQIPNAEHISFDYIDALFELDLEAKFVAKILLYGPSNINAQENRNNTALQIAVEMCNKRAVQMLLEYGADPNIIHNYPLQTACYKGYEQLARMLIEAKADVNAQGGYYGNALQAACYMGNEQIARMLIEAKADVNAQGGYYGNALQAACYMGDEQIARMLIEEFKADVNAQGGNFGNALQAAYTKGHEQIVKLLTDHGAVWVKK